MITKIQSKLQLIRQDTNPEFDEIMIRQAKRNLLNIKRIDKRRLTINTNKLLFAKGNSKANAGRLTNSYFKNADAVNPNAR